MIVEKTAVPPGRKAAAQAATIEAGSGTCSSISRHVTTSNEPGAATARLLDVDAAVVDLQAARSRVLPGGFDVLGRHIDGDDARAARRQALGQQAAAAADVEDARAGQRHALRDVVETQRR